MARVVKVARVGRTRENPLDQLATLCFLYPQYTLAGARRLPHKHVVLLMKAARKQQAAGYYNLTQIAAAPHTKKGTGVKKLSKHFEDIING